MTARSIRRAAERKAAKVARQSVATQSAQIEPTEPAPLDLLPPAPPSPARLAANQANAQLSTGPRTDEGKAKVSLNAVKSGLTGHTVLLPSDDAAAYELHLLSYRQQFQPVGPEESALVQSLADIRWRLARIPALEMTIYAKGALEFAATFNHRPAAERPALIELETYLAYEKQIRNLQLQEARLYRRREKEMAELRTLQQTRKQHQQQQLQRAAKLYAAAKNDPAPFDPAAHGFEFSTREIESFIQANPRALSAAA